MPLPKPSKMISKRFKQPKTLNPFIPASKQQPLPLHSAKSPFPLRKWRLRVVCTDPDATDDSSADELDSPASSRKRLIHEILLPVPPASPPQPSTPQDTRPRQRRQTPNSNPIARSRKFCCDFRDTEVILQDMDALFDAASEICMAGAHNRATVLPDPAMIRPDAECVLAEEEFARFVSEFVTDIGENRIYEDGMEGSGMAREDEIADMLNLELDSEALTWINSLQRLP